MKPCRGALWVCALVLLAAEASPARAAWCNVFQVTCFRCRKQTTAAYYYAPAPTVAYSAPSCCPPPQPVCTTRYVQRCYYQPVTTYQTKTYYEPVTSYRTSYYYEPVTSYRYSCYYDPCTCSYQQVACPTTSYQLRSQCCPVQSWVQRCCQVPVTSYQQAFYYEPVTECCQPANPCQPTAAVAAAPAPDCGNPAAAASPAYPTYPTTPAAPGAQPGATPRVDEQPNRINTDGLRFYPSTPRESMPPASGSSLRQPLPAAPPPVKFDRIASGLAGQVQGQVVRADARPLANVRVLFVCADRREPQQTAATDGSGKFEVSLASGSWLVYLPGADGKPSFQRKIDVQNNQPRQMLLVSR